MSSARVIVMDIGNSNTDMALFENSQLIESDFLPSLAEYAEKICRIAEDWNRQKPVESVVIASVVPALGDLMVTRLESHLSVQPLMVEDFKTQLLPLRVDRPETVGVDRIVNCYAARELYGAPAIVISLGTATTFEVISSEGDYLGGAIVPGVKISLEALTQKAALLPPAILKKPKRLIAKNTLEHMESGIYYGTVGMIEGMVKRLRAEIGAEAPVIATGGLSTILLDEGVFDHHEPRLTLKGLELIWRRMRRSE